MRRQGPPYDRNGACFPQMPCSVKYEMWQRPCFPDLTHMCEHQHTLPKTSTHTQHCKSFVQTLPPKAAPQPAQVCVEQAWGHLFTFHQHNVLLPCCWLPSSLWWIWLPNNLLSSSCSNKSQEAEVQISLPLPMGPC